MNDGWRTKTNCYGHSLNLAASDAIWNSKLMKDALDTTHEITKLIKFSPGREAIFWANRQENGMLTDSSSTVGIRVLYSTRWTVRADSLFSVVENYTILINTWDEATRVIRDMETKARIVGVQSQMQKFSLCLVYTLERWYFSTQIISTKHCNPILFVQLKDKM